MATTSRYVPPYFFQIHEIEHNILFPDDHDRHGGWKPSMVPGANRNIENSAAKLWFCNGQNIEEVSGCPRGTVSYHAFSIYYTGGVGIWTSKGDARNPPDSVAWNKLSFTYDNPDCSSFLTDAGDYPTIRCQQPNSKWTNLLLPDIYHTSELPRHQSYGGIVGELPIFIALMALSTSREYLPAVLPRMLQNGRWVAEHQLIPRMEKRGLVVKVYTCPPGYPTSTSPGSSGAILQRYERGDWGRYFD